MDSIVVTSLPTSFPDMATVSHRWFNNKARTRAYIPGTHTHIQLSRRRSRTWPAHCLSLLIWQLTICIDMCVCVCVCMSVQASSATSCLPQYNGKQASCLSVCVCVPFSSWPKRSEPFSGMATCVKFFAEQWKVRGLGSSKDSSHTYTPTQRDKYSYWAC